MNSTELESRRFRVSWLSVLLLAAPLSLLGELVITRTHHRPLGAVALATVALGGWLVLELVLRRLFDRSRPGSGVEGSERASAEASGSGDQLLQRAGRSGAAGGRLATTLRLLGALGVLLVVARAVL